MNGIHIQVYKYVTIWLSVVLDTVDFPLECVHIFRTSILIVLFIQVLTRWMKHVAEVFPHLSLLNLSQQMLSMGASKGGGKAGGSSSSLTDGTARGGNAGGAAGGGSGGNANHGGANARRNNRSGT
jgi:hypothetical protein